MEGGHTVEDLTILPGPSYVPLDSSKYVGRPLAEHLLDNVASNLESFGDIRWISNGAKLALGRSQVFGEASHSLAEVEPRARQMARILHHKFGLRRGDVVHLLMPSNCEMYFGVLGTWLLQGVVSPGDPGLSAEVVSLQLEEVRPKVVFCCLATVDKVREVLEVRGEDTPVIVMDGGEDDGRREEFSLESLLEEDKANKFADPPPAAVVTENEAVLICWSSGTTGRPKGILHGPRMFLRLLGQKDPWNKTVQTTCLFHLGGFAHPLRAMVTGKETIFIAEEDLEDDVRVILTVAEHVSADSLLCGSHHLIQLAAAKSPAPAPSVKMIMPLGTNLYEAINDDLKQAFPSILGILNIYGQSEAGGGLTIGFNQRTLGNLICPAVRIASPSTGEAVGPGVVGEITYRADTAMLGYLNHPEENIQFFGRDGFHHSGDLGHYDHKGDLFFDGRLKELIKYKNYHLYPNELEEMLLCHEDVEDAAVFGRPEPAVQELVTALVVRREGATVTAEELRMMVDARVDDHKKLRGGLKFVEKIPRNLQGKIVRRGLADIAI